jgi:hypothetical protein
MDKQKIKRILEYIEQEKISEEEIDYLIDRLDSEKILARFNKKIVDLSNKVSVKEFKDKLLSLEEYFDKTVPFKPEDYKNVDDNLENLRCPF